MAFLNAIEMTDELQARIRTESGGVAPDFWDYETFTQEKVRQKVKARAAHGIRSIQYFDVSEVWHPWARDQLRDSFFRPESRSVGGAIGQLESTTVIALPGSSWEQSLLAQARNVLEHYPGMRGMFMDQVYYDLADLIHDDGVSIQRDGTPFARQHWALAQVMRKIKGMLAAQDKVMVINQAWNSIEIGSIGDLMLVEGGGRGLIRLLESLKYFGIGNRLAFDQVPFEDEAQDCLRYGWTMNHWTDPGDYESDSRFTRLRFSRLYYPLFELLKGRTWVLEPHCLDLPEGFDGNLFRRPDGGFVVTVVTPRASSASPWTRARLPVRVRFADAADVKAAYIVTADLLGPRRIDFQRDGREILVTLPRHRSATAVLLATSGRYLSTPRFGIAPDENVTLQLDNFTAEPWAWHGTIVRGETTARRTITVAPGDSHLFKMPTEGASHQHGVATFAVESPTGGTLPTIDPDQAPTPLSTFEMVLEPTIAPMLAPPPATVFSRNRDRPWEMYLFALSRVDLTQGMSYDFQLAVTNHASDAVTLTPRLNVEGGRVRTAPGPLAIPAGATRTATVTVEALTPGPGRLSVSTETSHGETRRSLPFNVVATAPLRDGAAGIESVHLAADVFYTGSGNPQITLNGVDAGTLFAEWSPHPFSWYAAGTRFRLNDAAVDAVAETNEVRLDPPNGMLLKVRNLALVVVYADGRTAVVPADPTVQTAADTAALAEGRYVPRGEVMVWRCPAVR